MKTVYIESQDCTYFKDKYSYIYEERCLLIAEDSLVIMQLFSNDTYIKKLKELGACKNVEIIKLGEKEKDLLANIEKNIDSKKILEGVLLLKAYLPNTRMKSFADLHNMELDGHNFFINYESKLSLLKLQEIIPIIDSVIFSNVDCLFDALDDDVKFPIVLKKNYSIGGNGVHVIYNKEDLLTFRDDFNGIVLIQPFLEVDFEGSVQYIKQNNKYAIILCETMIEKNKFMGFKYPVTVHKNIVEELMIYAESIYSNLVEKEESISDMFGIDFIISSSKIYFHDINPRKTGVNYIIKFLLNIYGSIDNLNIISKICKLTKSIAYEDILTQIEYSGIQWLDKCGEGVFILNPSLIKIDEIHILCVSKQGIAEEYLRQVINIL